MDRFAAAGTAAELRLPDGPADPAWPSEITATINRVAAEALSNISRHAPGALEVTVTLAHSRQAVRVEVSDDAPPAGSPRFPHSSGYGLIGMRERVEALGGTLTAGPRQIAADGRQVPGWTVLATLPLPSRDRP